MQFFILDQWVLEYTKNECRFSLSSSGQLLLGSEIQKNHTLLHVYRKTDLKADDFKIISLGVSMKFPEDYEAHIVPHSSTFKKWGILQINHMGVIDNSYSGDNDIWGIPVLAMGDTVINENDRICQFRIVERMGHIKMT